VHKYTYEYTDTFGGEANYCWVKRGVVSVPELVHYGYTGSTDGTYTKASKAQMRALVTLVKRELGLTGVPCAREDYGHDIILRPYGKATVLFIDFKE
jgi:hypothetical protein